MQIWPRLDWDVFLASFYGIIARLVRLLGLVTSVIGLSTLAFHLLFHLSSAGFTRRSVASWGRSMRVKIMNITYLITRQAGHGGLVH